MSPICAWTGSDIEFGPCRPAKVADWTRITSDAGAPSPGRPGPREYVTLRIPPPRAAPVATYDAGDGRRVH
ncbi:hypothetical protein [Actinomadura geliboluensis]|uniref:hypothetical protein n=1 Tax=Actinomadura geliboluensis TaxID=882440 RepID=UPI00371B270F